MYHYSIPHSQQSITRSVTTCHMSRMGNKTCNNLSSTKIYCTLANEIQNTFTRSLLKYFYFMIYLSIGRQTCNLFYQRRCSLSLIILHTQQTGCVIPWSKTHTHTHKTLCFKQQCDDSGHYMNQRLYSRMTPHISRPDGRAMGCLLWGFSAEPGPTIAISSAIMVYFVWRLKENWDKTVIKLNNEEHVGWYVIIKTDGLDDNKDGVVISFFHNKLCIKIW